MAGLFGGGGGGGSSSAPEPPDYESLAREQAGLNRTAAREQTAANRYNQRGPFQWTDWSQTPYTDPVTGEESSQWTQTNQLNPTLAGNLYNQLELGSYRSQMARGMFGQAQAAMGQPMNYSGFQGYGSVDAPRSQGVVPGAQALQYLPGVGQGQSSDQHRKAGEDAAYGRATARLDPQFEQREQDLEVKLRNQGLRPGTEAYDRARGNFDRDRSDAYGQARRASTAEGRQESQQSFAQQQQQDAQRYGQQAGNFGLNQGQFGNIFNQNQQRFNMGQGQQNQLFNQQMGQQRQNAGLRSQQIAEQMQRRGMPLQDINRLLAGQGIQPPQGQQGFNQQYSAPPDLLGAATSTYRGQQDQFNAGQAQQQQTQNGLFGLGSAAISAIPFGSIFGV